MRIHRPGMTGLPFTAEVVARFAGGAEPMQPAGAAALELAWRHRACLLDGLRPA